MQKTQTIELLKLLNKQELRKLIHYVGLPYHNSNEDVSRLLLYFKKYAPNYDSPKLEKQEVYRYLFNEQKGKRPYLNKLAHQLKCLLEDFLSQYDVLENKILKEKQLIKSLETRNHLSSVKRIKKLIVTIKEKQLREKSTNDFLDLFQLNYAILSDVNSQKLDEGIANLKDANRNLDVYYCTNKLKLILEYKTSKSLILSTIKIPDYSLLLSIISTDQAFKEDVTIQLLLKAIQMVENKKEADFFELKDFFFTSINKMSKENARFILISLTNMYNFFLNKDTQYWSKIAYDIFVFADANDLLVQNSRIRNSEYTNAALIGFYTGNMDWTLHFIEKYKSYLAYDQQEETYASVKAFYYFQLKEFDKAITILQPIEQLKNLSTSTEIKIRTLKMRAFYERWEMAKYPNGLEQNLLLHLTKNFRRYILKDKKLAITKKKTYIEFLDTIATLVKLNNPNKRTFDKLRNLQEYIENTTSVALRSWLQGKIRIKIENTEAQSKR